MLITLIYKELFVFCSWWGRGWRGCDGQRWDTGRYTGGWRTRQNTRTRCVLAVQAICYVFTLYIQTIKMFVSNFLKSKKKYKSYWYFSYRTNSWLYFTKFYGNISIYSFVTSVWFWKLLFNDGGKQISQMLYIRLVIEGLNS